MRLFARISMVACYIGRLLGQPYNILPTSLESRPILFYKILQWLISVYHYQYSYFCICVVVCVSLHIFECICECICVCVGVYVNNFI